MAYDLKDVRNMANFFLWNFSLANSPDLSLVKAALKKGGDSCIQTSRGICIRSTRNGETLAAQLEASGLKVASALKPIHASEGLGADVKAFIKGVPGA